MQQALVHILRHHVAAAVEMRECLVKHMQGQRNVVRHRSLSTKPWSQVKCYTPYCSSNPADSAAPTGAKNDLLVEAIKCIVSRQSPVTRT